MGCAAGRLHIIFQPVPCRYHEGTSQSAGYVAGAAALLLAAYQTAGFNITGMAVTIKANLLDSVLQLASLANTSVSGDKIAVRSESLESVHQLTEAGRQRRSSHA